MRFGVICCCECLMSTILWILINRIFIIPKVIKQIWSSYNILLFITKIKFEVEKPFCIHYALVGSNSYASQCILGTWRQNHFKDGVKRQKKSGYPVAPLSHHLRPGLQISQLLLERKINTILIQSTTVRFYCLLQLDSTTMAKCNLNCNKRSFKYVRVLHVMPLR